MPDQCPWGAGIETAQVGSFGPDDGGIPQRIVDWVRQEADG
jgi:hypothetical protein